MVTLASRNELVNSGHTYLVAALQFETGTNHEVSLI